MTARFHETLECELEWERNRGQTKLEGVVLHYPMGNALMRDLIDVARATDDPVFVDALMKLHKLQFDKADYRLRINGMLRKQMTEAENLIAMMVLQEIEDTKCSQQAAYERIAAREGIEADTFDGAAKAVRRVMEKHRGAPNAMTEY